MDVPLARNDHLDIEDNEAAREGSPTQPRRTVAANPARRSGGPGFHNLNSEDEMGLLSVGHLQSQDLRTVLYDGLFISAAYMIVGTAWFMSSSKWSFTTTAYFMVISVLTIGYGDVTVRKRSVDRVIDSLLIVVGLAALGVWAAYAQRALNIRRLMRNSRGEDIPDFDAKKSMAQDRRKIVVHLLLMIVIILFGTIVFMYGEGEDFTTSFYWTVVTASTIGYGDVVPTTQPMRWFTIFYSMVATVWMFQSLRLVGGFLFRLWGWKAQAKVFDQFARPETPEEHARLTALAQHAVAKCLGKPPEQPGCVTRSEFALSMLLLLDRISYKDYLEVARVFDGLDPTGEGVIRQSGVPAAVGGVSR